MWPLVLSLALLATPPHHHPVNWKILLSRAEWTQQEPQLETPESLSERLTFYLKNPVKPIS